MIHITCLADAKNRIFLYMGGKQILVHILLIYAVFIRLSSAIIGNNFSGRRKSIQRKILLATSFHCSFAKRHYQIFLKNTLNIFNIVYYTFICVLRSYHFPSQYRPNRDQNVTKPLHGEGAHSVTQESFLLKIYLVA